MSLYSSKQADPVEEDHQQALKLEYIEMSLRLKDGASPWLAGRQEINSLMFAQMPLI